MRGGAIPGPDGRDIIDGGAGLAACLARYAASRSETGSLSGTCAWESKSVSLICRPEFALHFNKFENRFIPQSFFPYFYFPISSMSHAVRDIESMGSEGGLER